VQRGTESCMPDALFTSEHQCVMNTLIRLLLQLKLEVAALVLPTKSSLRRTSSTQFWRHKEAWTHFICQYKIKRRDDWTCVYMC
jgi:hypothetical protein